ncbi:hypothetical protein [Streptomyces sp. NPDC047706]|uniref:hypothetical protein n=1 Tax=Streptomyces sp. NPDC047706 TaxID=3365486 RepID=UPI003711B826
MQWFKRSAAVLAVVGTYQRDAGDSATFCDCVLRGLSPGEIPPLSFVLFDALEVETARIIQETKLATALDQRDDETVVTLGIAVLVPFGRRTATGGDRCP